MTDPTPRARPLFRVWSKGTAHAPLEIERGAHWALSRRGWLSVFPDRLQMGGWSIPYDSIEDATLFRLKSLLGGYVLRVDAEGSTYQFGINPWALEGKTLPFPHVVEDTKVRYSTFSILVRIVLLAWVLFWLAGRL